MNSDNRKPLPLGIPPKGAEPGEPTPPHVLETLLRIAAEPWCINPLKKLIFYNCGRVVNRRVFRY